MKDFYLDERALAAYFEKDWADHFHSLPMVFAPFNTSEVYSDYHERLGDLIAKSGVHPQSLLEVGSALGRTYFEVCKKLKSLKVATLIEPSAHLAAGFKSIFSGAELVSIPTLKGNVDLQMVKMDTRPVQTACAGVDVALLQSDYQSLSKSLGPFELTICSNVIDQCREPEQLVEFLKNSTAVGGTLVLSCTYQWQTKYIGNAVKQIKDINDLFGNEWQRLAETNIPFQLRANERHWKKFLSHILILNKIEHA